MKNWNYGARDQRGLTLIEFMMAIAIASVIFMMLYTILAAALTSYSVGQLRSAAVQGGRVAMNRILNDLKYADDIYVADEDRIYFRCPMEGDITSHNVDYRYYPGNQIIKRSISDIPGEHTFMEGVASFTLIFRDSYNYQLIVPVSEPYKIRYVEIDMRLQKDEYQIVLHNLVVFENPLMVPNP